MYSWNGYWEYELAARDKYEKEDRELWATCANMGGRDVAGEDQEEQGRPGRAGRIAMARHSSGIQAGK